jgi:hypothetical protein
MKISKLALIALLGGALMSFGCSDDASGTAGGGGEGGAAGGTGGGGGAAAACVPAAKMCGNGAIGPIEQTCTLAAPPADDNCVGDENLDNPATCTATGTTVTVNVTQLEVGGDTKLFCSGGDNDGDPCASDDDCPGGTCDGTMTVCSADTTDDKDGDRCASDDDCPGGTCSLEEQWGECNTGYNLDSCDGNSCIPGMLAPGEGIDGVDNALAGLAPVLAGVDGDLNGVNQAFLDSLCDGAIAISFAIDANTEEGCANVDVLSDGEVTDSIILNLSETGCISGTIGSIPLNVGGEAGSMANAVIRATLSEGGLSNGSLGATIDAATAVAIAEALLPGAGAVVGQVLDINNDLSGDSSLPCDALSAEMTVGGVVPAAQ